VASSPAASLTHTYLYGIVLWCAQAHTHKQVAYFLKRPKVWSPLSEQEGNTLRRKEAAGANTHGDSAVQESHRTGIEGLNNSWRNKEKQSDPRRSRRKPLPLSQQTDEDGRRDRWDRKTDRHTDDPSTDIWPQVARACKALCYMVQWGKCTSANIRPVGQKDRQAGVSCPERQTGGRVLPRR
jgi:hypothetical protein